MSVSPLLSRCGRVLARPSLILRYLQRQLLARVKSARALARLGRGTAPGAPALSRALASARARFLSPEERAWVDRIEALRSELAASRETISLIDYGAVSPGFQPESGNGERGVAATKTVGEVCRASANSFVWCLVIFRLVREFRPRNSLELGTSLGISGAYLAAALELNQRGRLVSLEGAGALSALARGHFQRLGLNRIAVVPGRFQETLEGVARGLSPIDFAFIDGHHSETATLQYFRMLIPFLGPRAVVVIDDIAWSRGMARAWRAIISERRAAIAIDLYKLGVCVISAPAGPPLRLRLAIG